MAERTVWRVRSSEWPRHSRSSSRSDTGEVYLATVLGAWVADRLLGSERTLSFAGVLIMIGHICLALVPGLGGVALGLTCVGLGSGALKANTTALLGRPLPRR